MLCSLFRGGRKRFMIHSNTSSTCVIWPTIRTQHCLVVSFLHHLVWEPVNRESYILSQLMHSSTLRKWTCLAITKDKICRSARKRLHRRIGKAAKGRTGHYSNIDNGRHTKTGKILVPYGTPTYILAGNGPEFLSKFFAAVTAHLKINNLKATAWYPQTDTQRERINRTIVVHNGQKVPEHQTDWDQYVPALT